MAATITATAQALYDFNQDGSSPNCLAFKQSELIYVYERLDSGWWQGVLVATPTQGGWFPANYAQVVEEGPPANPPNADAQSVSTEDLDEDQADADSTSDTTSTHNQVSGNQPLLESTILAAVALQDYQANAYDGDALSFRKGDSLAVLEMNPTGLWKGFINGKEGYFPSRYVRLEDSSSSGSNENLRQSLAGLENRKSSASMASPLSAPRAQTPVQAAAPPKPVLAVAPRPWKWTKTPNGKDYLYNPKTFERAWTVDDIKFGPGEDIYPNQPQAAPAAPGSPSSLTAASKLSGSRDSVSSLSSINSPSVLDLTASIHNNTRTSSADGTTGSSSRRAPAPAPPPSSGGAASPLLGKKPIGGVAMPSVFPKPTADSGAGAAAAAAAAAADEANERAKLEQEEKRRLEQLLKETQDRLEQEKKRTEQMQRDAEERRKERERFEAENRAAENRRRAEQEEQKKKAAAEAAASLAQMEDQQRKVAEARIKAEQAAEKQAMEAKLRELENRLAMERARAEKFEREEAEKRAQEEKQREARFKQMEEQQKFLREQAEREAEEKRQLEARVRQEQAEFERKIKEDMEKANAAKAAEEKAIMQKKVQEMEQKLQEEKNRLDAMAREKEANKAIEEQQRKKMEMQKQLMEAESKLAEEKKRNEDLEIKRAFSELERQMESERQALETALAVDTPPALRSAMNQIPGTIKKSLSGTLPPVPVGPGSAKPPGVLPKLPAGLPPPVLPANLAKLPLPNLPPPPAHAAFGAAPGAASGPGAAPSTSVVAAAAAARAAKTNAAAALAAVQGASAPASSYPAASSLPPPSPSALLPSPPTTVYKTDNKQHLDESLQTLSSKIDLIFGHLLENARKGNLDEFVGAMKDSTTTLRDLLQIASIPADNVPAKGKLSVHMAAVSAALKAMLIQAKGIASALENRQPQGHLVTQLEKIASDGLIAKYDLIDYMQINAAQLFGFSDPLKEKYIVWAKQLDEQMEQLTGAIKYFAAIAKSALNDHYSDAAKSVISIVTVIRTFISSVVAETSDFTLKQNLNFSMMQLADNITLLMQTSNIAARVNNQETVQTMVNTAVKLAKVAKECSTFLNAKLSTM